MSKERLAAFLGIAAAFGDLPSFGTPLENAQHQKYYWVNGQSRRRISFGDDREGKDTPKYAEERRRIPNVCSGCRTKVGDLHVPGCENERCPHCNQFSPDCKCEKDVWNKG